MAHPLLYWLELRLKKDGSFGKGLNLYYNTSLVGIMVRFTQEPHTELASFWFCLQAIACISGPP